MGEENDSSDVQGKAFEMMEYLEMQVRKGKQAGADFSEIEEMLAGARIVLESGDFEDVVEMIYHCLENASKRFMDFEMLNTLLKKGAKDIEEARSAGKDVSEAEKYLKMARYHRETAKYCIGVIYARKAVEALSRKSEAEISWGSGLE